jgi:2-amino-4-hydroxy-6-hydroxymethyldihydropteridine diphosphokinase
MNSEPRIYIALGTNKAHDGLEGSEILRAALKSLAAKGIKIHAASRPWRTPAWPDPSDPPYTNAAARIGTALGPHELLDLLHAVEAQYGRARTVPNAPRALDLDLIDHGGRVERGEEGLIVPHPRATGRAFVLLPLFDVAPDWRDPVSGTSIEALIDALPDADRRAAWPAGSVLCAAAPGLKPDAR